jgi:hypothetical protein
MVSLCVLFVLPGACLLVSLRRFYVTLGSDSIEVRGSFTSLQVLRTEVAGFRILPTQYIATVVVVPRDSHQKTLKFSSILKTDAAYDAWFGTIPNLDAVERAESAPNSPRTPTSDFCPMSALIASNRQPSLPDRQHQHSGSRLLGLGFPASVSPGHCRPGAAAACGDFRIRALKRTLQP